MHFNLDKMYWIQNFFLLAVVEANRDKMIDFMEERAKNMTLENNNTFALDTNVTDQLSGDLKIIIDKDKQSNYQIYKLFYKYIK